MIPEMDDDSNEVDGSDVEPDYEYQPSGSVSDSDASLVDSLDEEHVMSGIPGRCELDGDKFGWENSSSEEDGPTRMVRYYTANNDKNENNVEKDASLYGQWLLVDYGRQGNRNYKGKASKNGHGNSGGYEKNENTGKPGVSNSVKKVDVVFPVANMGRSSQLKSGMNGKQSTVDKTYSASRVSGSRFEIQNTEDDGMIIEGDVLAKEVASGSKNIK
ncbi:hypothetical protein Q3G72_004773 [Acer saccharum]|nr:hypothetical protein Q3G72_004773 [Acer saccharum]